MMRKIRHLITPLLIVLALFSGQTMAGTPGHKFYYVQNADSILRHNADSEELRVAALEAAEECRVRYRKHAQGVQRDFIL